MKVKTHQCLSLSLIFIIILLAGLSLNFYFIFGIILGAAFPDVDNLSPKRESNTSIWGHRGITHTPFFIILIILLLIIVNIYFLNYTISKYTIFGFLIGSMMHIIEDCLNTKGCPLLYPFKPIHKRISFHLLKYDGKGEMIILLLSLIIIGLYIYYYINGSLSTLPTDIYNIIKNIISYIKGFSIS